MSSLNTATHLFSHDGLFYHCQLAQWLEENNSPRRAPNKIHKTAQLLRHDEEDLVVVLNLLCRDDRTR